MDDDMSKAFERLRKARTEEIRLHFEPGKQAGEKWAKEKAMPSQLRRLELNVTLANKDSEPGTCEDYIERIHSRDYGSVADCLGWDLMDPTDDSADSDKFWEEAIGRKGADEIKHDGYAAGFMVGALWVWAEFKASDKEENQ